VKGFVKGFFSWEYCVAMRIYQIVQAKGSHQVIGGLSCRFGKPRYIFWTISRLKSQRYYSPVSFNHDNCFMEIQSRTFHQDRLKSPDSSQHKLNNKPLSLTNSKIPSILSLLSCIKVIPIQKRLRSNRTIDNDRYHLSAVAIFITYLLSASICAKVL